MSSLISAILGSVVLAVSVEVVLLYVGAREGVKVEVENCETRLDDFWSNLSVKVQMDEC